LQSFYEEIALFSKMHVVANMCKFVIV